MGVPAARIVVHPNGVDPDLFDSERISPARRLQIRQRYGIAADATVCGFIGSFGKWHGVTVLAEAIRQLVTEREKWLRERRVHFLLIGDGLLMPDVRRILDDRTRPYATLTGLVNQDEAPDYLACADVLVSPHIPNEDGSPFFGSPTKLFEYMAVAKGIVASDLEQIGEILRNSYRADDLPARPCPPDEDKLAVLAKPGDRSQLIDGLRFLVEHPEYRQALGRNARREVVGRYTWDRNVAAVLERLP
jgi:glycosyltransferase involved in cell wall biosynthesis